VPLKQLLNAYSRRAALRRERLGNSSTRRNGRGKKAGCSRNRRKKRRNQYRTIIDVTGAPPLRRRRNGSTPESYSERASVRIWRLRARTVKPEETAVPRQLLCKDVTVATNTHATIVVSNTQLLGTGKKANSFRQTFLCRY
jgi:hypothetical protein